MKLLSVNDKKNQINPKNCSFWTVDYESELRFQKNVKSNVGHLFIAIKAITKYDRRLI